MVRDAKPEEYPTPAKWCGLLEDQDGELLGYVCASIMSGIPVIHDLEHWGDDAYGAARLLIAARKQVRAWGYEKVYVNILAGATDMLEPLMRHGFRIVQIFLEGEI